MSDQTSAHLELMRQMGAERHEGFNPIAPRSHRWMMDADELEETRLFGWVLWRTIDRDPQGQTGPLKKTRTPYAHDSRAGRKGQKSHLETRHAAEDLGMSVPNATDALRRLEEAGKVRTDDKGRIWLRGDAPEPRRIRGEDDGEGRSENLFCAEKMTPSMLLKLNTLQKKNRAEYVRHFEAMYRGPGRRFAEWLETLEEERRSELTWDFLSDRVYADQLLADAMLAARTVDDELRERSYQKAGFQDPETRGRTRTERQLTIDLQVRVDREQFFSIQKNGSDSVQRPEPILSRSKNGSAQKSASLSGFSESSESFRVSAEAATAEPHETPPPPPAPPQTKAEASKGHSQGQGDEPGTVSSWVEAHFGHRLDNKLRAELDEMPAQLGIPARSVVRFMKAKAEAKRAAGKEITSPGALRDFTRSDLPAWTRQHGREIESDRKWEEAEQRARAAPSDEKPFDPADYGPLMRSLAAKKGIS